MLRFIRNGGVGYGIAIGVGAAILIPVAAKVIAGIGKPLIKESIKGGLYLVDQGKVMAAEARETLEDLTAEARTEMETSKKSSGEGKKTSSGGSSKKTS
jgi:hypothetical protein